MTGIENIDGLGEAEMLELTKVSDRYAFRANDYYLSLIDWEDPFDPIRRLIIPDIKELERWGGVDASRESDFTVMPGLQHKYPSTALMLVSNVCGGICRYCFRKRLFFQDHSETVRDIPAAVQYIASHEEITNVLLTGGDPLLLSTSRLERIISPLRHIDHVRIIRLGSKVPAFNPFRILDDPSLLDLIRTYSTLNRKIYIITHFNHLKELTPHAVRAVNLLHKAGALLANQTPILRGINDDPGDLAELFKALAATGVPPYYVFQCRPAVGNKTYSVPIETAYDIVEQAKSMVSGLAKRARLTMSHVTGKIEIIGRDKDHIFFKYHRAAREEDNSRVMVFKSNPFAYWLDDYEEARFKLGSGRVCETFGPNGSSTG